MRRALAGTRLSEAPGRGRAGVDGATAGDGVRVLDFDFRLEACGRRARAAAAGLRRVSVEIEPAPRPLPPLPLPLAVPPVVRGADGDWRFESPWIDGRVRADLSGARVRCASASLGFATVVRTVLALDVLARGGLVAHAVGVGEEAAAVFTGVSGAGKSTLGELCVRGGMPRLSDELVVLLPAREGWVAHATPWNVGSERRAPLALLGTLIHDRLHRVESAAPAELLRVLVQNLLLPDRSPAARATAFRTAVALAGAVQTVRLRFARDIGVAGALKAALDCR